ncbi:MAG: GTP-binding protein [Telluria sp.]|nr:GTP-binding protein [Telluria sp.]
MNAIPVTVITGFLGSGKTTLINRLLREQHGQRLAVIENEFGAVGIDADILAVEHEETVIELDNGCICCTVRGDLAKALDQLAQRAERGEIRFDRVVIETTGIADPGPIIQTFLAETTLLTKFYLDGICTLVDTVHLRGQLDRPEVKCQIALADRIVFTKTDLADAAQVREVRALVAAMNPRASIDAFALHDADIGRLVDQLFEARAYQFDTMKLAPPVSSHAMPERHTTDVSTFTFESEQALDPARLDQCLLAIQQRYGSRLWRYKGLLQMAGCRQRVILQGVQGLLQMNFGTIWRPYEARRSVIVFIGQSLDQLSITMALGACRT